MRIGGDHAFLTLPPFRKKSTLNLFQNLANTSTHMSPVSDINIVENAVLPAPEYLCREVPCSETQSDFVSRSRREIGNVLSGADPRLLVIIGPCSIHDVVAGHEYAQKLAELARKVGDKMLIVMRVYFEKPRTTVGWKGLIMDPHLDGSYDIPAGLKLARKFLLDVIDLGLPTATELLDPITPQYIADLICWSAIGARTSESQTHRQMASGLSMPLGIKNGTTGEIVPAINAIRAAREPQTFLGVSQQGLASAVTTRGNPNCHIILRGSDGGTNYQHEHVENTRNMLINAGLNPVIMVDCSHGNSGKNPTAQPNVFREVMEQRTGDSRSIFGLMLESNLVAGNQSFPQPLENLRYGQSITDACIGWEMTKELISSEYEKITRHEAQLKT